MDPQITISSIVFIVWLIFPGVIFKRFYYQGQFTKQFSFGLFADRLITSIFWGCFVQLITFLLYSRSLGFTFTGIKGHLNRVYDQIINNRLPDLQYHHLVYILGYASALIFVASILGTFLHKVVRLLKIDVHFELFRFANQWHYYFKGDILSTRDFSSLPKGKVLSTFVDALVDDGSERNKMVTGFLTQYTISAQTGELETIHLTRASRYSNSQANFKEIPGHVLSIPYSRIIDLNLRYNIVEIDNSRRDATFVVVIQFVGWVGLIASFIYPWYLDANLFKTIVGMLSSTFAWLLLIAVAQNPFQRRSNENMDRRAVVTAIGISLILALVALQAFGKLLPLVGVIWSFIQPAFH